MLSYINMMHIVIIVIHTHTLYDTSTDRLSTESDYRQHPFNALPPKIPTIKSSHNQKMDYPSFPQNNHDNMVNIVLSFLDFISHRFITKLDHIV